MGWVDVLDALEREVGLLEQLADAGDAAAARPWEPPAALGPLPVELRERAVALLDRQRRALARVEPLLAGTRQQLDAVRRTGHAGPRPGTPVYVDVTA